jgi:broad specificity phosphatase PhoE
MRRLLLLALLLTSASTLVAAEHPATTVILIRHAEKAAPNGDPPLTAAGAGRAKELAHILGSSDIRAIYVTQLQRTRLTAEPLAKAIGVEPVVFKTGDDYAKRVVADILAKHAGETVFVVGHNNTTAEVMRQLGIAEAKTIPDSEFDNLFVCVVRDGSATLVRLRYGIATP